MEVSEAQVAGARAPPQVLCLPFFLWRAELPTEAGVLSFSSALRPGRNGQE